MAERIVMYRGDDRSFEFTLTADGLPIDLTDASVVFTARADIDAAEPTFSLDSDTGGITIDPDQADYGIGMVTLNIPASATVDLERNTTLLCDFEVTDGYGNVRTWPEAVYGASTLIRLRVKGDITHA